MQRLICTRCGASIHPDTAKKNNGLCVPCVRGNQLTIEQRRENRRKEREEEEAWEASPERKFWISLVDRVYKEPGGFDALPQGEQMFFLIQILGGEIRNGGFDQFFSNSSGKYYDETVAALKEMGEWAVLELLEAAKTILFADAEVPKDRVARFNLMPTQSEEHPQHHAASLRLDELDKKFYADDGYLTHSLERLAAHHGFYEDV